MSILINVQRRVFSGYISKRVTRVESDVELTQEDVAANASGPNDYPPSQLENRNPRNLEQLSFEVKPLGWELDRARRTFWNKVILEKFKSRLEAKVVHHSGRVIVSASTIEDKFASQLKNLTGIEAAENLGQVLARRCLENGILYALNGITIEEMKSRKTAAFIEGITKSGLCLKEPLFIWPRRRRDL
ncbi:39S ribosomal protein L18, mitochondrial-like [Panonychus citri]|uniref:39S ribosomal protein L18, mitochondrial-like n=1 Tax=Panonychus citri TaxID=50023 RepID=UPI002307FC64|nr:39S ribosomal protein L18, mitochondrial-like [Panonychus citri]